MFDSIEFRTVTNDNGTKKLQYRCLQFENTTEVTEFLDEVDTVEVYGFSKWMDFPSVS